MQMHLTIAVLFAITVFLSFIEERLKERDKIIILASYVCFMVFLATTKDIEHTADAAEYEKMFMLHDTFLIQLTTEPSFIYLSRIVMAFGGSIATMFLIYALVTIPAKMKILYTMTPYIFTALIIYIPVYYEVHDTIQIRAAAAAMFLLWFVFYIAQKKYLIATPLLVCAILCHYSAAVYLPFLFIGNRQLGFYGRVAVAVLVPFCFMMYMLKLDWFSLIPDFLVWGKIDIYKESTAKGKWDEFSPLYLNIYYLAKCAVLYLCLYYYDFLVKKNPLAPILINLFAISVCFLTSMATIPVIAGRISDMFGIIDCIVFTYCLYIISPHWIARIAIIVAGLYMLLWNMFLTEYYT